MVAYRPACGSLDFHSGHMHWNHDRTWAVDCLGYSLRQADVATMIRAAEWARTRLTYNGEPLDEGTFLEAGPDALSALRANFVVGFEDVIAGLGIKIGLPVREASDLPANGWRIVIDQGVIRNGVG